MFAEQRRAGPASRLPLLQPLHPQEHPLHPQRRVRPQRRVHLLQVPARLLVLSHVEASFVEASFDICPVDTKIATPSPWTNSFPVAVYGCCHLTSRPDKQWSTNNPIDSTKRTSHSLIFIFCDRHVAFKLFHYFPVAVLYPDELFVVFARQYTRSLIQGANSTTTNSIQQRFSE